MNSFSVKAGLVLLWLTLTCSSVFAQKVSSTSDPNFDFSKHKRYAWLENRLLTRQHPDTNEVMNLKIVKAVDRILTSRGFEKDNGKPDFYVNYDGGGESDLAAAPAARVNSGPVLSNDRTPTYGLGNGPTMAPSTWLKVNGQISFRITDAMSKKQVWSTTYAKTFRDPDKALRNMDKEVNELVTKSFKQFPPKVYQ
jgi:hypothetical protein